MSLRPLARRRSGGAVHAHRQEDAAHRALEHQRHARQDTRAAAGAGCVVARCGDVAGDDADGDFPALRTPKFTFQKIRLADISLSTASIELDLGVDNEHASNLWFTNFDYGLGLNGATVASGLIDDLGEVAGASTGEASAASIGTLTLPIEIDLFSLGSAGVDIYNALVNNEPLNVDLVAATDVDTPFGVVTLSIDESGDVSID